MKKIKKGDQFLCFKTVRMNGNGKIEYIQGKIYTSEKDRCITNESRNSSHTWEKELEVFFVAKEITGAKAFIKEHDLKKHDLIECTDTDGERSIAYFSESVSNKPTHINLGYYLDTDGELISEHIKSYDIDKCRVIKNNK